MHLDRLELEQFRLYRSLSLPIPASGLRIVGANASGKSTLVEAIAMLATMRSSRGGSDREVIAWQSGKDLGYPPYARVDGSATTVHGESSVEIGLQVDPSGEGPLKKSVKVDGRAVRVVDAVGRIKVVLFSPEDVLLVSGPPSGRRRYLDLFISQVDGRYIRALSRYNRILEQRNSLLRTLSKEGRGSANGSATTQLAFWDEELVTYGAYLVARRATACVALTRLAKDRFGAFSPGGELVIEYKTNVDELLPSLAGRGDDIETVRLAAQRSFSSALESRRSDELRRGVSLVGPHRDDISLALNGFDVGTYGSRGQQRLVVVALKLAEAGVMRDDAGDPPIILLDDVLSELDRAHRDGLLSAASACGGQLILTSTDAQPLDAPAIADLNAISVSAGQVSPTN